MHRDMTHSSTRCGYSLYDSQRSFGTKRARAGPATRVLGMEEPANPEGMEVVEGGPAEMEVEPPGGGSCGGGA